MDRRGKVRIVILLLLLIAGLALVISKSIDEREDEQTVVEFFDSQTESLEAITADPSLADIVARYREVLGAFVVDMEVHVVMERGPITKKLVRKNHIEYDREGKWHLVREDPLQQSRWEIYSLGKGSRKLYLRKNNEDFEFAADPLELNRWLDTTMLDFYLLVARYRSMLLSTEAASTAKQTTIQGLASRCETWQENPNPEESKKIQLCIAEKGEIILTGKYEEVSRHEADDFPVGKRVEASFVLQRHGEAVKAVVVPLQP